MSAVWLQYRSMVEYLVIRSSKLVRKSLGFPRHLRLYVGNSYTQHLHVRRLNEVGISGFHRSHAKDVGGATRSQPCSRVKNGIDAFVEGLHMPLHGNPTMTLRLVAPNEHSPISLIQEYYRGPFRKDSRRSNLLEFL
ncbi:hypothetical protein TNCV_890841 [Trichonephila clavipes]|nr:hypothetical protein TNCV_890841 [Trichonephila clavipes]